MTDTTLPPTAAAATAEVETDFNLGDIFEAIADAVPDRPAIGYEGIDVSYRELDERANAMGHLLQARGSGPATMSRCT